MRGMKLKDQLDAGLRLEEAVAGWLQYPACRGDEDDGADFSLGKGRTLASPAPAASPQHNKHDLTCTGTPDS